MANKIQAREFRLVGVEEKKLGSTPLVALTLKSYGGDDCFDSRVTLYVTPEQAQGVRLGDTWTLEPTTEARVADVGSLTPIADVVAATERRVARMGLAERSPDPAENVFAAIDDYERLRTSVSRLADMEHAGISDVETRAGLDMVPDVSEGEHQL